MSNKADKLSNYFTKIPELTDPAQKSVFFAKFPIREDKPVQYDKKLSTWSNVITDSSLLLGEFSFSINELKSRFSLGIQPVCLDTVVTELVKSGAIQSKNEFMAPEQSWTGWAVGIMFSPVKKLTSSSRINSDEKYIALDAVKQRADELFSKYKESTKLVADIYNDITDLVASPQDLALLLQHLIKSKRAISFELNTLTGERLEAIKFATGEVTDAERGVLQMKLTSKRLETQRLELEEKVASLTEQAKQATKSKQKDKALLLLKQRRKLNDLCLKRMNMLDTLHQILEKIDEAHTNYEIMQAYKIGAETLKNVTQNYGLTKEAVDDIKDAVFETLADQQEIDDALAEPVSGFNYDEDELEEELNKLVGEELPVTSTPVATTEDDDVEDMLAQLNSLKIVTESPQLPTKNQEKQLA